MKHKGFVRQIAEEQMDDAVRRLQRTGIPRKHIFVDRSFRPDAEWLHRGDHLTVCSLRELGYGTEMLLTNLARLCEANITLRALDEPWYDLTDGDPKALVRGLAGICCTKKRASHQQYPGKKKRPGRPPGMTATTESKCQRCAELLSKTDRTQTEVLASLHLSYRSWKNYLVLTALQIQKGKKRPLK